MADAPRKCSECDSPVTGRAVTCSPTCRSRRRRRIADARARGEVAERDAEQTAKELLQSELRPVVREAITEDVLDRIADVVAQVPTALEVAVAGLDAIDPTTGKPDFTERRQAAALILRHTIGNAAVVPDINKDSQVPMQVVFNLPRPSVANGMDDSVEQGVIETKTCDSCHTTKPADQFVGASDRCTECFQKMRDAAKQLVGAEAVEQGG